MFVTVVYDENKSITLNIQRSTRLEVFRSYIQKLTKIPYDSIVLFVFSAFPFRTFSPASHALCFTCGSAADVTMGIFYIVT